MTTALSILIVITAGMLLAARLLRTFLYPSPGAMPAVVEGDVGAVLQRFERALSEHAPGVLLSLQPGLSDDEIAAIESRYRVRLTDELRALYRWRNGSSEEARAELVPGYWFLPLDQAARIREARRRELGDAPLVERVAFILFAGHRTGWLAVIEDICGDGYFYDPARRRRGGSFFYCFAEDRQYRFFPSLANFLAGAAECYETGIYTGGRRGRTKEDFERSYALWPRYAAWSS
jgi:cell wall assembly regulator SMI1